MPCSNKAVLIDLTEQEYAKLQELTASLDQAQSKMAQDGVSIKDVIGHRALLKRRHDRLDQFLFDHSDAGLYGGQMRGASNKWTPGRWAEAAGPSPYRSAAKFIRAVLRSQS